MPEEPQTCECCDTELTDGLVCPECGHEHEPEPTLDPKVVEILDGLDRKDIEQYLSETGPWPEAAQQYAVLDATGQRGLFPYACALYLLHRALAEKLSEQVEEGLSIHDVNNWGSLLSSIVAFRVHHQNFDEGIVHNMGQNVLMAVAGMIQTKPPPGGSH